MTINHIKWYLRYPSCTRGRIHGKEQFQVVSQKTEKGRSLINPNKFPTSQPGADPDEKPIPTQ